MLAVIWSEEDRSGALPGGLDWVLLLVLLVVGLVVVAVGSGVGFVIADVVFVVDAVGGCCGF